MLWRSPNRRTLNDAFAAAVITFVVSAALYYWGT